MSHQGNTEYLEDAREDFDLFIANYDWANAQAIIDGIRENGFEYEADILRKAYLQAQAQYANMREDEAAGPYDPDNYKPEYPRE